MPYGEVTVDIMRNPLAVQADFQNLKELVILDPASGTPLLDDSFDSPTFEKIIRDHIEDYIKEYK